MEYKIERLKPGARYVAQIRSISDDQASEWSPAFYLTIPSDSTIPADVSSVTSSYTNYSFKFTWPAVTTNSDGTPIKDLAGYEVTVSDGTNTYTAFTDSRSYIISPALYQSNLNNGDTVDVAVVARDISGNTSVTAADGNQVAPVPSTVTGFTASPAVSTIDLKWTAVTNTAILDYEVYSGTSGGFTPDTTTFTNLVGRATGTSMTWTSGGNTATAQYFKIRARSIYGTYSATFASDNDTTIAGSSAASVIVKDDGTTLTSGVTSMDFVGSGVSATNSGSVVTVSVSGGGSASAAGYVTNIGDGTTTSYTVTHGLATKDVQVNIYENASPYEEVLATVRHTTTNALTVIFSSAPTTNQYRIVITPTDTGAAQRDIQTFDYEGPLVTYVGTGRYYVETNCTISSIRASVGVAPTGASVKVDVNKNGTTVFTTQANRPTIAISGFTSGAVTSMDVTSLTAGDYLTVDIDQIGSTLPGETLAVTVVMV